MGLLTTGSSIKSYLDFVQLKHDYFTCICFAAFLRLLEAQPRQHDVLEFFEHISLAIFDI